MPVEDTEGFTQIALPAPQQPGQVVAHGLYVQFYLHPCENQAQTTKQGRPIFEEKEYIRIMVPGDKSSIIERPVRVGDLPNMDNHKYGIEYDAFKRGAEQGLVGTPLAEWPMITRSQAKELEYFNVRTVEQLSSMPDTSVQNFAGLANLREQAKRFIEQAEAGAPLAQMQAELSFRDETIAAQGNAIDEMRKELAELKHEQLAIKQDSVSAMPEPDPVTETPVPTPKPKAKAKAKRKIAE